MSKNILKVKEKTEKIVKDTNVDVVDILGEGHSKKKKITKIIVIVGVLILILLLAIMFFINNNKKTTGALLPSLDGSLSDGILSGLSPEELERLLQDQADASMFSFQINAKPIFENGQSKGNLQIGNPPSNLHDIQVDINLDSSGELLYKSGLVPPNKHIAEVALSKNLPKGIHKATANINVYQKEPPQLLGQTSAQLYINIQN